MRLVAVGELWVKSLKEGFLVFLLGGIGWVLSGFYGSLVAFLVGLEWFLNGFLFS